MPSYPYPKHFLLLNRSRSVNPPTNTLWNNIENEIYALSWSYFQFASHFQLRQVTPFEASINDNINLSITNYVWSASFASEFELEIRTISSIGASDWVPFSPPINVEFYVSGSNPYITGSLVVGGELQIVPGTWWGFGEETSSFSYQWLQNGSNISGATSSNYTSQVGDIDQQISCRIIPINSYNGQGEYETSYVIIQTEFEPNDFAYSTGYFTGGEKWDGNWQIDGIFPKLWSNGTSTGGSGISGWEWDGNWILG